MTTRKSLFKSARSICAALLLTAIAFSPVLAEPSKRIGQFRDWGAYTYSTPKGPVCYVLSLPKDKKPTGVNRDPVYFFVTDRPGEQISNEISIIIGYPFRTDSKGTVEVISSRGTSSYTLITNEDTAWLENAAEQPNLVNDMRAGRDMVVKGTSQRGTLTTDTYSLFGISDALKAAKGACGAA